MIDLSNLHMAGVVSASGEQNEDGTFSVECEIAVETDSGFRGSLLVKCPHATKPVKVKNPFSDDDELDMIIWLMENGFTGTPTMEQDENDPYIIHAKTPLNVTCGQRFGVFTFGGEDGE